MTASDRKATDVTTLGVRLRRAAGAVRWYVRGMVGADAYERYAAHHRAHHPDTPLPDERTFWREKYAEMERNPRSRCC